MITGDTQDERPGDGPEDEHVDDKPTEHVAGGSTDEPSLSSQHPQVRPPPQSPIHRLVCKSHTLESSLELLNVRVRVESPVDMSSQVASEVHDFMYNEHS